MVFDGFSAKSGKNVTFPRSKRVHLAKLVKSGQNGENQLKSLKTGDLASYLAQRRVFGQSEMSENGVFSDISRPSWGVQTRIDHKRHSSLGSGFSTWSGTVVRLTRDSAVGVPSPVYPPRAPDPIDNALGAPYMGMYRVLLGPSRV